MSPDQKVLIEAERWFRALLRGASVRLRPHELALFSALAERQNTRGNIFVSRDFTPPVQPVFPVPEPRFEAVATTLRPSPKKMQGLIERSKKPKPKK